MRGLVGSVIVSVALVSAAPGLAADLPVKAPPLAPAAYGWSGCYVGANAGGVWMGRGVGLRGTDTGTGGFGSELADGSTPSSFGLRERGFIGGGQLGCNWQTGRFVWGVETDFDLSGASNGLTQVNLPQPPFPFRSAITTTASNKLDWLGTTRGRLGYTVADQWLLYVTGGVAYGQTDLGISSLCPTCAPARTAIASNSSVTAGWVVGAGAEWAVSSNWSVKAEYLHFDLGTKSAGLIYNYGPFTSTMTASLKESGDIVRAGLNYRFNWGALPIVARY